MKKLLLTLGAVASVAAPVAAVVACSSDADTIKTLKSTKTEDVLKALSTTSYEKVAELDAAFGITTNAGAGKVTKVLYKDGKLTFTTDVAGDTEDFTFKITAHAETITIAEANKRIVTLLAGISTNPLVKPLPEVKGKYGAMNVESDLQRKLVIVNTGFEVTFTNTTSPAGHQTETLYFATNDHAAIQAELDRMNKGVTSTPLPVTAAPAVKVTTETFTYTDATCQGADVVIHESDLKKLGTKFDDATEATLEAIIAKIA